MMTEHSRIMADVYNDDKRGKLQAVITNTGKMRRENNVFQNQQITRIEKDLEKTSR